MIVFLTLIYVGVLAGLVKGGIIRLNAFWKISPALWMLLLLIVLFIPMQWGAPAGNVNVYEYVIEIVPNVAGEVIEVTADGLKPLEKGDVLFRIDPEPYQAVVDQFNASLEDAKQSVERLQVSVSIAQEDVEKAEQQIELAKTDQVAAEAGLAGAEAAFRQAETDLALAETTLKDVEVQVVAASREFDRIKDLFNKGSGSASDVDRAQVQYTNLRLKRDSAALSVKSAKDGVQAARSKVDVAKADVTSSQQRLQQLIETDLPRSKASLQDAELAANSMIGDEHTTVATARAQLAKAEYDLKETTVTAPADGWAVGVTLRPGQRVANLPLRAAMSFVDAEQTRFVIGINQYAMRHVKPGQEAEITLKLFPGQILKGEVEKIAWTTPGGQLAYGGNIPAAPDGSQVVIPFGVVVRMLDDTPLNPGRFPGGAIGSAAVYTDRMKPTHVIRRVMIRMDAWMNYIIPF